jgi:hypothetical protein
MAKRQTAQQRYEEQVARRAQSKRQYEVTIIVAEANHRETVTVSAVDERLAETQAMISCTYPLAGEHVEYAVREIR